MKAQVNEIKISYQGGLKSKDWEKINTSEQAANILFDNWDKNTFEIQECFKVILMNNANRVKGIYEISQGDMTSTLVDLRLLYAVVLKSASVAIILAHNHPSGTLRPSRADRELTKKIKRAGELFDIKLLDHMIIVPNGEYYSFSDNGIL